MQVFNALNGTELIEVIKDRIGKKLEASGEFKYHLTFPWSRISFAVGVVAYPQQAMDDTDPKIKVKGAEIFGEGEAPSGAPVTVSVSGGAVLDTPDKDRVEAQIPVPTIVEGPGGQKIDKPVLRAPVPPKKGRE